MFIKFGGVLLNIARIDCLQPTDGQAGQSDQIRAHTVDDYVAESFYTREARDARFTELEALLCDSKTAEPAQSLNQELLDALRDMLACWRNAGIAHGWECAANAEKAIKNAERAASATEPAPQPKRKVTVYLSSDVSTEAAEKARYFLIILSGPPNVVQQWAFNHMDRYRLTHGMFAGVEFDLQADQSTWIDHGGHNPAACARLHNAVMGIISA